LGGDFYFHIDGAGLGRERGRGNFFTGRKFGEEKRIQGKKDFGQIHIVKSHFADEERLWGKDRETSRKTF
jgi:hypothetical protein